MTAWRVVKAAGWAVVWTWVALGVLAAFAANAVATAVQARRAR